tara:strand:- start:329 stop:1279 length:951 start_codon:yes stop_codon:yes gene_type:complete
MKLEPTFLKLSQTTIITNSFKYLLLGTALFGLSTFSKPAEASTPPKCTLPSALGPIDDLGRYQSSRNDAKARSLNFCTHTPDRFEITIFELGLCEEEPFTSSSKIFNRTTGKCTITMTSSGSVADIANSSISLPQMSGRPANGEYQYAYVIIKNEFGLRGSLTMDDGSDSTPKTFFQYCSDNEGVSTGQASSCTAQNHTEELDDFGDSDEDPENQELGYRDFFPTTGDYEDMGNNEGVSALLVKDDLSQAGDRLVTRKLIGLFKSAPSNKVKITNSTNGLEMQLTVTDLGYGVAFDGNGEPVDFGSMPFKPIFTTF